jgi:hypothetical protein
VLYQNYETDISKENLFEVFSKIQEPICLLGGWAVYLTVNESFREAHVRDYHGSKDIDIGFHIQTNNLTKLSESTFIKTIRCLEESGFVPLSQRFVKFYHTESREELTENESKRFAQPFIFNLFVDPIVDHIPKNAKEILGFVPIDEPLLSVVFQRKKYNIINAFGASLILPHPEVLLSTKINSVHRRTKDHKKIKDICDIYALIWHSNLGHKKLHKKLCTILNIQYIVDILSKITKDDCQKAADALGVDTLEFSNVIKSFTHF